MGREFEQATHRLVQKMFVDTADDNYIAARWCFCRRLQIDYHWLSVHTLEKYLKAILLLNEKSSKGFGHKIVDLYREVQSIAPELLPQDLEKPPSLECRWRREKVLSFLERLYLYGEAHNRYDQFGFIQMSDDLFKLDRIVFSLRRLCCRLDDPCFPGHPEKGSNRAMLLKQPEWWHLGSSGKIEETVSGKRDGELQRVLLNWNVLFAPDGFRHDAARPAMSMSNSPLGTEIITPLNTGSSTEQEVAREVRNWVFANIVISKEAEDELRSAGPSG